MQLAVRAEETYFDGADGHRLYERRWRPEGAATATVLIVHGYAEHSGRYEYVGQALAARGFDVRAYDLRGHGHSDGRRAYVRSFSEHLRDLAIALDRARSDGRPVFLLGHSMGGAVVALAIAVEHTNVRGVVLTGAALPATEKPRLIERIMLVVGRVAPRLPLFKLKATDVSRDPEISRLYDADPLNYRGRVHAGIAAALIRAGLRIDEDDPHVELPLLIMHGSLDALTSPDGSRRLYERVASTDKTLKIYEGLYHEVLNEPERDDLIAEIAGWFDAHLEASPAK
ncbi:MAG TPA: lysophospholipase [Dehalococcoidia bacterium]